MPHAPAKSVGATLCGSSTRNRWRRISVADNELNYPPAARMHHLDGLRAVAVTLVVFCHTFGGPLSDTLRERGLTYLGDLLFLTSRSGVELFFVLSGTVILRPYLRHQKPFNTKHYTFRRLVRICPPYWAALGFAGAVILVVTLAPSAYSARVLPEFSWLDWLAAIGIFSFSDVSYNTAWWSLKIELVFYLIIPLIVWPLVRARFTRPVALALFVGAAFVSIGGAINYGELSEVGLNSLSGIWYLVGMFLLYSPCFVAGIAIARFDWSARVGRALVAVGTLYVLLAVAVPGTNIHLGFALLYSGVVVVSFEQGRRLNTWLSDWFAVWLGERSYSLFLIHFSLLYIVYHLVSLTIGDRGIAYVVLTRAIGVPIALLGSMVLFSVIERRFAQKLVTADSFWPWPRRSLADDE